MCKLLLIILRGKMHTSEENKYREGSLEGWWCLACFPSLSKSKYVVYAG